MQEGVVLTEAELQGSCPELCRLHSMISLMSFNEVGTLIVRVLTKKCKSKRDVVVCPSQLRGRVTADTHSQSLQGYSRTLNRLKLKWFWLGMSSMVRRVVKKCDTCQKAKKSSNKDHSTGGTLSVG